MLKTLIVLTVAVIGLSGCAKSNAPSSSAAASGDPVQQKLQQLAGSGATDCGRLQTQAPERLKPAGDCAMQASQSKHAFFVAYDMPGLTVGVAGDAAGKLSYVQAELPENGKPGGTANIQSAACPAGLRIAVSGRITCFAAGGMGAPSHGSMSMPPAGGENPHGGMGMPPPGTPNPHAGQAPRPETRKN